MTPASVPGDAASLVSGGLDAADLAPTWHEQFADWLATARAQGPAAGLTDPTAVVLATVGPDGQPSTRTVLLKGVGPEGFVLFTNYTSRKGSEIAANPRVSLCFSWVPLAWQVVVVGVAERVSAPETDRYAHSRPHGSQLSAWTSRQSRPVAQRAVLEARAARLARRWPQQVPVPDFWGGLRVVPASVEFWAGRADRLHDRLRYRRRDAAEDWVVERLQP